MAHPGTNKSGSTKVRISIFFHSFFYTSVHNSKTKKPRIISNTFLKSWLKNLSNEYMYICWTNVEQNPRYLLPKLTLPQTKNIYNFSKVLTLKADTGKLRENKGVLCFDIFLVGVLTIEQKIQKHDLEESLLGVLTTLFPTVNWSLGRIRKNDQNYWLFGTLYDKISNIKISDSQYVKKFN